ncbi:MAG: hypothetical protein A2Y25_04880 [Candidatus Melainabacteria bacterium GWF2_37_15]|nr:MAG: hypothetical protein A2Y25_04880 [Candidatus Melainabacteria bacterium GWF2_37_15]
MNNKQKFVNNKQTHTPVNNTKKLSFGQKLDNFVKMMEFEISTKCNYGKCSYCPVSLESSPVIQRIMPMKLFKKILNDLKAIGYKGKISYQRYNEPLAVKAEDYVKKTKQALPDAQTEIFTNGILLSEARLDSLRESGVDKFIVTQHSKNGFITRLGDISDEKLKGVSVRYGDELSLSNRGGTLINIAPPRKQPCSRPSETMVIDVDGNVFVCSDDYYKREKMGSVKTSSIKDIWLSTRYTNFRENLKKGNREASSTCKSCSRVDSDNTLYNPDRLRNNEALFRKRLLEETGSARLPVQEKKAS